MGLRNRKKDSDGSETGKVESQESTEKAGTTKQKKSFDVEAKIAKIQASKMPESQKVAFIQRLKIDNASESVKISFAVYCQRKKIKPHLRVPMQAYPPAKGVRSAPFEVWEEIYKNF